MKEISLKSLLDTTFTINEKGEMVGEFTLKRINKIGDILTDQLKEIERLNKELEKYKYTADELNEIERLNNIIEEVREYAKNDDNFFIIDAYSQPIVDRIQEDILEILNKGDD